MLILNASYEPLKIVTWKRGVLLYFSEKIDVLHWYSGIQIHSISQVFDVPSVIRLKQFYRPKRHQKHGVGFSRQYVFLRDDYQCQYCYKVFAAKELTLDHVVPLYQGGITTWENVVSCCKRCNQLKGARTPEQAGFTLAKLPKEPRHGFLLDLLHYRRVGFPETWKPYVASLVSGF